ncbi:MAG: S8 family serine peptidase [Phycisphaerales bacterium]|nr:MAG: S8 family serine peptidase [Phycisphaerales bacterium]
MRRFRDLWTFTTACLMAGLLAGCADQQGKKIKITKLDDLPQHTYPVEGKVSDMVKSEQRTMALAKQIRADIEKDLATYEIDDPTTLQRIYGRLATIDMLEGKYKDALKRLDQVRALEDKEAARLTSGLTSRSMIAARNEADPNSDMTAYKKAYRRILAEQLARLPWEIVQDEIEGAKGMLEIRSETLMMGMIEARMEPVVAKTGELNADDASSVVGIYYTIKERLPLNDETIGVYQEIIDANRKEKPNIWADRSVALSPGDKLNPVLIAVWDSGTDPKVFDKALWTNSKEKPDGIDNDGNGYIDDIHGIAYDIHARRTTDMLCPLEDTAERIHEVMKHMKGFTDLQAAVDSPEASALKKHLSTMEPAQVKGFIEDLMLAGNYAHGTHVAGLMVDGNPAAELLIARLSYDHRMIPVARTVEWGRRDGAKCRDTVEYFKKAGVRLVNMSWGEARQDAEDSLEANGIGANAEERRELSRKVFELQRQGLYEAINNAPDILFICAAGNADNDVEFDDYIPSSFDLPNLLVVGAVDQAGEPTSFTSSGRTVQVYGNGFEVDSYIPGGERMKMSGTSMASPNVANLAAKLLAIDQELTPPDVIELIKKGADKKTSGEVTYLLINPQRTVRLLKSRT